MREGEKRGGSHSSVLCLSDGFMGSWMFADSLLPRFRSLAHYSARLFARILLAAYIEYYIYLSGTKETDRP